MLQRWFIFLTNIFFWLYELVTYNIFSMLKAYHTSENFHQIWISCNKKRILTLFIWYIIPGRLKKSHNNRLIYIIFQIYFAEHQSKNLFPLESSNWILQKRSLSFMNYFFGISFPESISGSTSQWIIRFMTIQYFSGIQ